MVNVWGVGYRLVDGPPVELARHEPAPALAPAAAVAALPLLAVGRPLDAALLAPWLLAVRRPRRSAVFWRLQLRRGRELVARACHELRGPLTAAHLALHAGARHGEPPPARVVAVERELDRAAVALEDLAAARHGRRAPDRDEPVDVGDLLAYQAADLAHGRGGLRLPGRARRAALGRDRCAATACAWRRRSATSWPTRSSTATGACGCGPARRATACASRSTTRVRGCRRRWAT